MRPEQAWQAALGQLQMEMPKATFDTWVRGAELVSYEDGAFVIGVANEYARDWLAGRLTSTLTRLLTGLMNQGVDVRFVTDRGPGETDTVEAESDEGTPLKIQVAYQSLWEAFVQPQKVVVVPAYLKRWIPYLGCFVTWIVIAFRQLFFLSTRGKSVGSDTEGVEFEVTPGAGARWAGTDRSNFRKHLNDPMLGWFLKKTARSQHSYRFLLSMPLTPGDAEALYEWLVKHDMREAPLAALETALATATKEIIPETPSAPRPEYLAMKPNPESVQDVVLRAWGRASSNLFRQVMGKANELAHHLMPPSDVLLITHYFMLNHLPELGAAPAMFITLMRDKCYVTKNETRDRILIRSGNAEIAQMLGLERPKTVSEWLPPRLEYPAKPPQTQDPEKLHEYEYRQQLREAKRAYVRRFVERDDDDETTKVGSIKLKVQTIEPLTGEDQTEYDWLLQLVVDYIKTRDRSNIDTLLEQYGLGSGSDDGAKTPADGAITPPTSAKTARKLHPTARESHPNGAITPPTRRETAALSSLKHLVNVLKQLEQKNTSNLSDHENENASQTSIVVVVVGDSWKLSELLSYNPKIPVRWKKDLIEKEVSASAWVARLLYAASPAGAGIKDPPVWAASHLLEDPSRGVGEAYDHLAALAPKVLLGFIETELAKPGQVANPTWQEVMSSVGEERLRTLRKWLCGV